QRCAAAAALPGIAPGPAGIAATDSQRHSSLSRRLDGSNAGRLQTLIMRLQGKVAVITGASMGIGEAIAKLFLQEGAKLVLCARDVGRVQVTAARIGGTADTSLAVACDVSKREQVDALAEAAVRKFGRIDIWVNNAGFGLNDSVEKLDITQLRQMF